MTFRGVVRKATPKYMFQVGFLKIPIKFGEFYFWRCFLKTVAKMSILMNLGGGGVRRTAPKYIFHVCFQYPSSQRLLKFTTNYCILEP